MPFTMSKKDVPHQAHTGRKKTMKAYSKLGEKKKRQFKHVLNSILKNTGDESRAIAGAISVTSSVDNSNLLQLEGYLQEIKEWIRET